MINLGKTNALGKISLLEDNLSQDEDASSFESFSINSEDELSIQSHDDDPLLAYSLFDDFASPHALDVWHHMSDNFRFSTDAIMTLDTNEYGLISLINYLRGIKSQQGGEGAQREWQNILIGSSQWRSSYQDYLIPTHDDKLIWDRPDELAFEDDSNLIDKRDSMYTNIPIIPEETKNSPDDQLLYNLEDTNRQKTWKTNKTHIDLGHHEEEYFEGYSNLNIHREMILDYQRTSVYKDFMMQNSALFRNKIVLDVGCGTGILSIFAAQAGAALVVAVDASHKTLNVAQEIIKLNKMQSKVKIVHGKMQDLNLYFSDDGHNVLVENQTTTTHKNLPFICDIIISEWMGYALLFESMIFPVLSARDRYLKEDGHILPNIATIGNFGCNLENKLSTRFNNWSSMYGLDLSPLQPTIKETLHTPEIMTIEPELITSPVQEFLMINLQKVKPSDISNLNYNLEIKSLSSMTSLGLYFNCYFISDLSKIASLHGIGSFSDSTSNEYVNYNKFREFIESSLKLETGPLNKPTHWKQSFLHLSNEDGSLYKSSDPLKLTLGLYPHSNQGESLMITIGMTSQQHGLKSINYYELI